MGGGLSRLILAAVMAAIAIFGYYGVNQKNPVTGEVQHVSLSPDQEVALGLESAPEMARQMGGELPDPEVQAYVSAIGQRVVDRSAAHNGPYRFQFHVLADPQTVNAFALPGGQIFITVGLLSKLRNEAQLAGVLGHEVGHVVGRHAAEHMAKSRMTQVLVGAAGVAASDGNYGSGQRAAMVASMVGNVLNLKYGRADELEADSLGLRFMSEAGYDPRAMIGVMDILESVSRGGNGPEWLQTHPNPGNRRQRIEQQIAQLYPAGVPAGLSMGSPGPFEATLKRLKA